MKTIEILSEIRSQYNCFDETEEPVYHALSEAIKALSAQQDIVHCGECEYQDKGENESEAWNQCGYRPWLYIPVHDEHYCSWGERREDEQMEHCSDIP